MNRHSTLGCDNAGKFRKDLARSHHIRCSLCKYRWFLNIQPSWVVQWEFDCWEFLGCTRVDGRKYEEAKCEWKSKLHSGGRQEVWRSQFQIQTQSVSNVQKPALFVYKSGLADPTSVWDQDQPMGSMKKGKKVIFPISFAWEWEEWGMGKCFYGLKASTQSGDGRQVATGVE